MNPSPTPPDPNPADSPTEKEGFHSIFQEWLSLIANLLSVLSSTFIVWAIVSIGVSSTEPTAINVTYWWVVILASLATIVVPPFALAWIRSGRKFRELRDAVPVAFLTLVLVFCAWTIYIKRELGWALILSLILHVWLKYSADGQSFAKDKKVSFVLGPLALLFSLAIIAIGIFWVPLENFDPLTEKKSGVELAMIHESDLAAKGEQELKDALAVSYTPDALISLEWSAGGKDFFAGRVNDSKEIPEDEKYYRLRGQIDSHVDSKKARLGEASSGFNDVSISEDANARTTFIAKNSIPIFGQKYCVFQSIPRYYLEAAKFDAEYAKDIPRKSILLNEAEDQAIAVTKNRARPRNFLTRSCERFNRVLGTLDSAKTGKRSAMEQRDYERTEWRRVYGQEYQVWLLKYDSISGVWQIDQFHGGLDVKRAKLWYADLQSPDKKQWHHLFGQNAEF